jgi:hypothetical protein
MEASTAPHPLARPSKSNGADLAASLRQMDPTARIDRPDTTPRVVEVIGLEPTTP